MRGYAIKVSVADRKSFFFSILFGSWVEFNMSPNKEKVNYT